MALWQAYYDLVPAELSADEFDPDAPWNGTELPENLLAAFSSVLPERPLSWAVGESRHWGAEDSHDITAWFQASSLQSLKARIDVRDQSWPDFVTQLVAITLPLGTVFRNEDGTEILPDAAALIADIRRSEAFAFVQAPAAALQQIAARQSRDGPPSNTA